PKTETGLPSAAQTLLKLTPAAITRTMTSKAPGSGTSICSSWKASFGSPSRSCRITQAAIVSGSVPGSTSSWVRLLVSTAKFPILPVGFPPAARDPRWCGGTSDGSRRVALALGVHLGGGLAELRRGDRADRDVSRLRRLDLLAGGDPHVLDLAQLGEEPPFHRADRFVVGLRRGGQAFA